MAGGTLTSCCATVQRKRVFELGTLEAGNLRRCLSRWDLTGLGVGSTLGVGTYVLIGYVAVNLAGPSVILSFLIAAVAALFAGLCYAELASRIPRAGTAYIYTYVTIGELAAFIVGWNNILEGIFSTASIAKGLSLYIDSMTNNTMSDWFTTVMPINVSFMSPYFDLLSFCVVLLIGVILAIGVRESAMANNVLTIINMAIILFIIIAGAIKANSDNWYIPASDVPPNFGSGGFFPYGVWGTLKGAAVCFYGFVGFDTISSAGEEAREPRQTIPLAILITLVSVFFIYTGVAIIVTMMVPYYLQESIGAVSGAFSYIGWEWARWIVSIGTICGITASLYGAMFPLPRLLYAMSSDGYFMGMFSKVTSKRKSPVIGTLIPAFMIAVLTGALELEQLLLLLCIGTLLSYTAVAACVILLRYRSDDEPVASGCCGKILACGMKFPSRISSRVVIITLILFLCVCVATSLVLIYTRDMIASLVLNGVALLLLSIMACQPKVQEELSSKTPLVPVIPCLSIYINIHLMALINGQTWLRIAVWMLIGIPFYLIFTCSSNRKKIKKSEESLPTVVQPEQNGKPPILIIVENPTPPNTTVLSRNTDEDHIQPEEAQKTPIQETVQIKEEPILKVAVVENTREKEAKIIDLLDQVLQAEEDRYGEIICLKDDTTNTGSVVNESMIQSKSLEELSDAGSDASLGNQALSKYDVIALVHREDLPIVCEEEERNDKSDIENRIIETEEHEEVTAFNESETNSRTDESGYSDTIIDRTNNVHGSTEDVKDVPYIPPPPPLDENYFAKPYFKKSFSMPKAKNKLLDSNEDLQIPRESIKSNSSLGEDNIVFGSVRQINFMSKLSDIYQNMLNNSNDDIELKKRSQSMGNLAEEVELSVDKRPSIFEDLKKEMLLKRGTNLRPTNVEETPETEVEKLQEKEEDDDDSSMNREDLKSKLESIFASGGPMLLKSRLMKSNPPTPEESYQTETSSPESIPKITKIDKNDTLSRQKAKFGEVLNSFRLSYNNAEQV